MKDICKVDELPSPSCHGSSPLHNPYQHIPLLLILQNIKIKESLELYYKIKEPSNNLGNDFFFLLDLYLRKLTPVNTFFTHFLQLQHKKHC